MVTFFRAIYAVAALLAVGVAVLVTASLLSADRGSHGSAVLISLAVAAVFLSVAFVVLGVRTHVSAIALTASAEEGSPAPSLAKHASRLLAHLVAAGTAVCAGLAGLIYGILERIQQGFAVFG